MSVLMAAITTEIEFMTDNHICIHYCYSLLILYILFVSFMKGSWSEWQARGPEHTKTLGVKGEDLK